MSKNYYFILGLSPQASSREIKNAFRRLAKEFHPDHHGDNAAPFRSIREAYSVLNDPEKKKAYDAKISRKKEININMQSPPTGRKYTGKVEPLVPEPKTPGFRNSMPAESFYSYSPVRETLFDSLLRNFSFDSPTEAVQAENLQVTLSLTPEQAIHGGHIRLLVPARLQCPGCEGNGNINMHQCRRCGGEGIVTGEYPVILHYPPGLPPNHVVRLPLYHVGIPKAFLTVHFRVG